MKEAIGRCLQLGKAGIYLSGGLDSGTLATYATEYAQEKLLPSPHALSLVYPDSEANEERIQKGIAGSLGIPQTLVFHELAIDADRLFSNSLNLNDTWPHPLVVGLSPLHLTLGARAREVGCDLVLSGEGGDEWLDVHRELAAVVPVQPPQQWSRCVLSVGIIAVSTILNGLPVGTSFSAICSIVNPQSAGIITEIPPLSFWYIMRFIFLPFFT